MKREKIKPGMRLLVDCSDYCDDSPLPEEHGMVVTVLAPPNELGEVHCATPSGKDAVIWAGSLKKIKKSWTEKHAMKIGRLINDKSISITKRIQALEDYMHSEQLRRKIIESYSAPEVEQEQGEVDQTAYEDLKTLGFWWHPGCQEWRLDGVGWLDLDGGMGLHCEKSPAGVELAVPKHSVKTMISGWNVLEAWRARNGE